MRRRAYAAALGLVVLATRPARAEETTMAEPVIDENITDIDSREKNSFEVDLTPGVFRSTSARSGFWHTAVEAEWRPFDRTGLGLELDAAGALDGARPTGATHIIPRGALSYVVFRDFDRQLFLQAEVGARYETTLPLTLVDPTEFGQPYWAGLREATKLGPIELRTGAFGQAGATAVHAPVRASEAVLYSIIGATTRGAIGAEVLADWSRAAPFVLAPEAQLLARVFGHPIRFGAAVPFTLRARGNEGAYGVALKFIFEPDE
jgi:hypothetical protein